MGCSKSKNTRHINRSTLHVDHFGESMPDNETNENDFIKLVLTGCSGVGKTVFYHTYFKSMDEYKNASTTPSGDNNCRKIFIEGKGSTTITIWDTAGQEKYASVTNIFYKNSQGIFLIYDVTDRESFNLIETHWLIEIRKIVDLSHISVCLVANKIDKTGRVVSSHEGEDFAKKLGFLYFETSALKNNGVNEAVQALTRDIMNKQ